MTRKWTRMALGAVVLSGAALAGAGPVAAADDAAARMGGTTITLDEVDAIVLKQDMKLAQSLYDARVKALDQLILERGLTGEATAAGVTVEELIKTRIAAQTTAVTDEQIAAFYEARKARMGGKTLEQMTPQIKAFLHNQREAEARKAVIEAVKRASDIVVMLDAPRAEVVVAANEPSWGKPDAKVTIVEYSDFQ